MNKKFELMLTRRAKTYSSSCSQSVSLLISVACSLYTKILKSKNLEKIIENFKNVKFIFSKNIFLTTWYK